MLAFVAFADHMNFTRAAAQLHISQPALHVQIKKLSHAVGVPLYRRAGRALVLTPEGQRLASFGREVAERGRAVLDEVRGTTPSGPVVLAAGQGALHYLLGPAIRRFPKQTWPLRVLALAGADAIRAVQEARAHLAVAAIDDVPADLAATRLCEIGQHVIVPASHRLAARRAVRAADLAGESIVVAPAGPHRTMLDHLLAGHSWYVAVEATGWELMLELARYGLGIAIVNDFCPAPKGMVAIPLHGAPRITYRLYQRRAFTFVGSDTLRRLVVDTIFG